MHSATLLISSKLHSPVLFSPPIFFNYNFKQEMKRNNMQYILLCPGKRCYTKKFSEVTPVIGRTEKIHVPIFSISLDFEEKIISINPTLRFYRKTESAAKIHTFQSQLVTIVQFFLYPLEFYFNRIRH